jgi:hypothetical protein
MPTRDDEDQGFSENRPENREDRPRRRRPVRREDYDDDEDDRDYRRDDYDGVGGFIPYRNGWALASYYLGVFSLIPCVGLFLSILAIIFGFLGLSHSKKNPESKGSVHAIVGLVLGSLVLLLHLAGIAFLLSTGRW